MVSRGVQQRSRQVDPMFPLPEGVEGFSYAQRQGLVGEVDYDETLEDEGLVDDTEILGLEVPDEFTIVDQVVRRLPDGGHVIDVIVDVEDIDGADKYEFRIVKV